MKDTDSKSSVWDNLSERQIKAVNYKILNPNARYAEIANELDIPEPTLSRWGLNAIVAEIRKDSGKAITAYADRLALKAMRVLEGQMDSDDERIAQSAAKEMLDRSLGKPTQNNTLSNPDGSNLLEGLTVVIAPKAE
jgi:transposase-like protein